MGVDESIMEKYDANSAQLVVPIAGSYVQLPNKNKELAVATANTSFRLDFNMILSPNFW